jgi:Uma2 family endonuclease
VQVAGTRYRIPDVCVLGQGAPREEIITHPPLLCVEILSKDDSMSGIMERVEEYLAMGVRYVWAIDPWRHRGYECTKEDGIREPKDGVLRTRSPELSVALTTLFRLSWAYPFTLISGRRNTGLGR